MRFVSHAFWLLQFWNHLKTIILHIALGVLKRKSYLLFPLVLRKDIQRHIKFPRNLEGPYQTKIALDYVISLSFWARGSFELY